jgi:hypothetical protein
VDLPKAAQRVLSEQFARSTSKRLKHQQSAGGDTTKLLIELQDGLQVETVIMHYDTSGAPPGDVGLCQAEHAPWGCALQGPVGAAAGWHACFLGGGADAAR